MVSSVVNDKVLGMDNQEAGELLERELSPFRCQSYSALVDRTSNEPVRLHRSGSTGQNYQLEIKFVWDERAGGDVRVLGSIDDGGWRTFLPHTRSFIKSPDDSVVRE